MVIWSRNKEYEFKINKEYEFKIQCEHKKWSSHSLFCSQKFFPLPKEVWFGRETKHTSSRFNTKSTIIVYAVNGRPRTS